MQIIRERNKSAKLLAKQNNAAFGRQIGLFAKLFGCWHKNLTRPFTIENFSYQACLHCGARKKFDAQNLKTIGSFHYPPPASLNKN